MSDIKQNIADIKQEIAEVCDKGNRNPDDILLLAVTKTVEPQRINEAIAEGITDIGENKVQEILNKYESVDPVRWHLIGHLQTNKVKYIIDKVHMIHSLDSIKLAEEIDKRAKQHQILMDVLIQINVAKEDTKFGLYVEEIDDFIKKVQEFENIHVKGLMTIAPYEENPEKVRPYFRTLKSIFERIKAQKLERIDMQYLSMGMSNDFKVAIEEGANMIRIGTAIFGKRNYNK
ncbi:MAG TPA: YggS family pyridoxal phosphate-dependent enzyme [Clostridiales bacterium]|nr:YggS family pyridoxal phosphate-dependent enzyme [Clostridiales bacterium]